MYVSGLTKRMQRAASVLGFRIEGALVLFAAKPFGTGTFNLDASTAAKLLEH